MFKTPFDNIRPLERLARLLLGTTMIALMFYPSLANPWITLASVYPIITAIMAWDPVYAMLGHLQPAPYKHDALKHAHV